MAQTFGLTSSGLVIMRQSDIVAALKAQMQAAFGQNLNFSGQAVIGQLVGIFSEREALLWELLEAVYNSQYPSGAEGTSVDNILALSNLKRLPATPTTSAPTSTAGIPGLVLYGTAGTVISAGSIISVQNNSLLQFTLDAAVTILAAVNAVQMIVLSAPPAPPTGSISAGTLQFTIVDPAGNTLTSPVLEWYTPTAQTQIFWTQVPMVGSFKIVLTSGLGTFTTASYTPSTAGATIQADIRAFNAAYSAVTVSGSISGSAATPTANLANGSYVLTALSSTTGIIIGMAISGSFIPGGTYVTNIIGNAVYISQAATNTVSGETVTFSGGLVIGWGTASQPTVSLSLNSLDQPGAVANSLQSVFNTFFDVTESNYPYTDVTCTGSLSAASIAVNFGAGVVVVNQPLSSAQPQALIDIIADSLQTGSTIVNTSVISSATGAPAEGIGSASCTQTGPNVVPAGYLSVIGSPVSGWASVTNPLDCVTGTNVEDDTQALTRRQADLASNANGPVQAIAEKVSLVPGVVQAVGFQNLSLAALQVLTFSAVPTSGQFALGLNGGLGLQVTPVINWRAFANVQAIYFTGAPTGGSFTITMNALTTSVIPSTANAATVQASVQALSGFSDAIVTGSFTAGFFFAFGAGSVQQYPISATDSLTGASISAVVPSVQAQVNSVAGYGQATIIGSFAAGMVVSFNASTGGQPQAAITTPTNTLEISATPITITQAFGRPGKSFEIVVNDNNGEASNQAIGDAIYGSAPAGIMSYGNQPPVSISDTFGNVYQIYFSRPTQVPIYVVVSLQTDLTTSSNPKFTVGSIINLQEDIAAVINAFPIGGLVIGYGTDGIVGSFNAIPGVISYTLSFGTAANPTQNTNIQLLPEQVALGETFNILVSYQ